MCCELVKILKKHEVPELLADWLKLTLDSKKYALATQLSEQYISDYPDHPKLLFRHAQIQIANRELDAATETLEKCVEIDPENKNFLHALGLVHIKRSEFEQAKDCFNKATVVDPTDLISKSALGGTQFLLGEKAEALATLLQCYQLNPRDPATLNFLSDVYYASNTREGREMALAALKESRTNEKPDSFTLNATYLRSAQLFEELGQARNSLEVLEEGYKKSPLNFKIGYPLACAYVRNNRKDDAIVILEELHKTNRRNVYSLLTLATLYISFDQTDLAKTALENARSVNSEVRLTNVYEAWNSLFKGQYQVAFDKAQDHLEKFNRHIDAYRIIKALGELKCNEEACCTIIDEALKKGILKSREKFEVKKDKDEITALKDARSSFSPFVQKLDGYYFVDTMIYIG